MSKFVLLLSIFILLFSATMADDIMSRFKQHNVQASECPLIKNQWLCYFSKLCTWYDGKCHEIIDTTEQQSEEETTQVEVDEKDSEEIGGTDWGCKYFKDPATCWLQYKHCHWTDGSCKSW